jgi:hypothetical protein
VIQRRRRDGPQGNHGLHDGSKGGLWPGSPPSSVMKTCQLVPIALISTFQNATHDVDSRFSAFISLGLHIDAHTYFRIFCARLRPFALDNFRLFDLRRAGSCDDLVGTASCPAVFLGPAS